MPVGAFSPPRQGTGAHVSAGSWSREAPPCACPMTLAYSASELEFGHFATLLHGSRGWRPERDRGSRAALCLTRDARLAFKLNQDRRHHIPEQKRKVTNWREYDESLRRRGSVTVWFSDEAVEAWEAERRTSRGGQPEYSDLAILTALTFKAVFRLAYRQTEGLIGSVIGLLGLDLAVPDHSTLCRR